MDTSLYRSRKPAVLFLFAIFTFLIVFLIRQYEYDDVGNRTAIRSNAGDYDFDGTPDTVEDSRCTSAESGDTDNDGIPDTVEDANNNGVVDAGETDPCNADTDGDQIQDGTEMGYAVPDSLDTDREVFIADADPSSADPTDSSDYPSPPIFETGKIEADQNWQTVTFDRVFVNPVVVAGPLGLNGSEPAIVRICNVTAAGFEVRVQEYGYQDGVHAQESIGYVVMEAGDYFLSDGTRLSAGSFTTATCNNFEAVSLNLAFNEVPVVLTSVGTENDPSAVLSDSRKRKPPIRFMAKRPYITLPGSHSLVSWRIITLR